MLAASPGTALAGYGPPPPPGPIPGGYFCVLTSQPAGAAGGAVEAFGLGGLVARLLVGLNALLGQVQITLTEPYGQDGDCLGLPDLGDAGFPGYGASAGVGILLQRGGLPYQGKVRKPLTLRLTSKSITRSSVIVVRHAGRFVRVPRAVVRRGWASVQASGNSDFAVLNRVTKPRSLATAPDLFRVAGAPLPGLGVLAHIGVRAPGAGGA